MGRLGRVDLSIKVTPVDHEKEIDRDLVDKTKIIYKSSKGIKKGTQECEIHEDEINWLIDNIIKDI